MLDASPLLLGVGLGLRHATDADHVAAVSTMLAGEARPLRALRLALLWGLGHTVSFLGVGAAVVLAGLQLPARLEQIAEVAIAILLVTLGFQHLRGRRHDLAAASARPVAVGLAHGVAGSAGVALLALTTMPSRPVAFMYLALFAIGTLSGMALLTAALVRPLAWSRRQSGSLAILLRHLPATLSLSLGGFMGFEVLSSALEAAR
jgi:hypothetical protein